jgi:NAD(P)-dependent dehydrogenase (short-subunit alcohol dehydrogenase family)
MDRSFSGRVALITGASGGIGQALTHRLAAEGAVLSLGYGAHG